MEAKNFRIGNWVQYKAKKDDFTTLTNSSFEGKWIEKTYNPILLDDAWLLDLGFKKLDKYTFVNKSFFVHKRKRGFVFGGKKAGTIIEYVHTLQNLFFALNGTELEFKP